MTPPAPPHSIAKMAEIVTAHRGALFAALLLAGAVVTPGKRLESGHVYAGNPARALRPLKEKERAFFPYTAGNYVRIKDDYLAAQEE